jgi:hypothetical protein
LRNCQEYKVIFQGGHKVQKKQTIKKPAVTKKSTASPASPKVNLQDFMEEIRARANEIYLKRGNAPGDELSDWLEAEKDIKKKYKIK